MFNFTLNPKAVFESSVATLKRFPLAILSAIIATMIAIYFIWHGTYYEDTVWLKLLYMFIVATFTFSAVELIKQKLSRTVYYTILALIVFGLYAFYLTFPSHISHWFVPTFRAIFLSFMFFVSILWSPWVFKESDNYEYWKYAKSVIISLLFTMFFVIVLILGVNGALLAIEELFNTHIKGKIYGTIDTFIVGIFGVWYFLSTLPLEPTKAVKNYKLPKTEIFFTKYVLTTLTVIYFLILYSYTFKIILTGVWPKSILSWLIIFFSVVAVATYLFWTHVGERKVSLLRKLIWLAIGLQTIMLFIAIGFRISAYSWTENRYMVVMFGIWLLLNSIYFLLFKNAKLKVIFISLSLLVAISQIGHLNVYSISKNAQTKRFKNFVKELKTKHTKESIPKKLQVEISNTLNYLCNHYNVEPIKETIPTIVKRYDKKDYCSYEFKQFVAKELGFKYDTRKYLSSIIDEFYSYRMEDDNVMDVKGYSYAIFIESYYKKNSYEYKEINTLIETNNSKIKVIKDGKVFIFDIAKLLERLKKKYKYTTGFVEKRDLTLRQTIDNTTVTLMVKDFYVSAYGNGYRFVVNAIVLI